MKYPVTLPDAFVTVVTFIPNIMLLSVMGTAIVLPLTAVAPLIVFDEYNMGTNRNAKGV